MNIVKCLQRSDLSFDESVCIDAAASGHKKCLQLAVEIGCPLTTTAIDKAAMAGNLEMMKYLHSVHCPMDDRIFSKIIASHNKECLLYALQNGFPRHPWIAYEACADFDMLQMVCEHGCPVDASVAQRAVLLNKIECLQYLHEHGCAWDESVVYTADQMGNNACLEYAILHGCPYDATTLAVLRSRRHTKHHRMGGNTTLEEDEPVCFTCC